MSQQKAHPDEEEEEETGESHYKVSGVAEGPKDGRGECSAGYCGVVIGGAEGFAERSLRGGSSRWKGVLMTLGLVPPRWGTGWLS